MAILDTLPLFLDDVPFQSKLQAGDVGKWMVAGFISLSITSSKYCLGSHPARLQTPNLSAMFLGPGTARYSRGRHVGP